MPCLESVSLMVHIKAGLFSHQKLSCLETFLELPHDAQAVPSPTLVSAWAEEAQLS